MGLRAGVVVCVTSFLLGALFTHWIADSLTLWKTPITDEHLWTAASYYSIITKGPSVILYLLAAVVSLGGVSIIWSLNDLRAGNIMFDGGSIFLFGTTTILYLSSVLPSLLVKFASLPSHNFRDPIPRSLRIATIELASNNLICSVALTGVLALQAGRSWVERSEGEDDEDFVMVESDDTPSNSPQIPHVAPLASKTIAKKSRAFSTDTNLCEDKVEPLLQARVEPA